MHTISKATIPSLALICVTIFVTACSTEQNDTEPQSPESATHGEAEPRWPTNAEIEAMIDGIVVEDRRTPHAPQAYQLSLAGVNGLALRDLAGYLDDPRPAIAYESVEFLDENGNVGPSRYTIGHHVTFVIKKRLYWDGRPATHYMFDFPPALNKPDALSTWLAASDYNAQILAADLKNRVAKTKASRLKAHTPNSRPPN